jgi:hypothetical protein
MVVLTMKLNETVKVNLNYALERRIKADSGSTKIQSGSTEPVIHETTPQSGLGLSKGARQYSRNN